MPSETVWLLPSSQIFIMLHREVKYSAATILISFNFSGPCISGSAASTKSIGERSKKINRILTLMIFAFCLFGGILSANAQSTIVCRGYNHCPSRCDICIDCAYSYAAWAEKACKVSGTSEPAKYMASKMRSSKTCTNRNVCEGACDLEDYKITCK